MKKVLVIDYGIGNIFNVIRAVKYLGFDCKLSSKADEIDHADSIILPGDGAFGDTTKEISKRNLIKPIINHAARNKPLLGICVGMQILSTYSKEFGYHKGLNLIPGKVIKFNVLKNPKHKYKIPHLGWNNIQRPENKSWNNTIFYGIRNKDCVYFIHSYVFIPKKTANILAFTEYAGQTYASAVQQGNVIGCQFHPEKSGKTGLKIISNFLQMI